MFMRHVRTALIPTLALGAIVGMSSDFARGGPPEKDHPGKREQAAGKERHAPHAVTNEQERPKAEVMMENLHGRMAGLRHLRHEAVKNGDVETVRKIDNMVERMIGTVDAAFPDLKHHVKNDHHAKGEQHAGENKPTANEIRQHKEQQEEHRQQQEKKERMEKEVREKRGG